jgi:CheY-like chemotaxis protein
MTLFCRIEAGYCRMPKTCASPVGLQNILVVDDDPGILDVLEQALDAEGYRVEVASNGQEALERVAGWRPNIMLVDLMMPVMDGRQFVEAFRSRFGFAGTPVIILSAARNVGEIAAELGVTAVVSKPFDLDELLNLIASHAS